MTKVVAYYRTSSVSNTGDGKDSEKRQKSACFKYAELNNMALVAEFYDAAVSGKDAIHDRDGFVELLEFCRLNDVQIILVESASRFSRDLLCQEHGFLALRQAGFNLIPTDAPQYFTDDTDNPSAKMIRQILGSVSEYEKEALVQKLRGARERKRKENGKCEGRKSYVEKKPELVREAKRLRRVNPNSKRQRSYRQISLLLAGKGYLTSTNTPLHATQIKRLCEGK
ncbi:MAG: recombinase family protein [Rhodospirillaceae bacterium]|mgnify:FL=1|jgi:DNA invertase Pin-like site-specific DNA recombinase|nr:recombinase family protein [Rhodospirillaceae bacterium]MBT5939549.1 recombinase family protein [Rhodospirillaceae bacterium]